MIVYIITKFRDYSFSQSKVKVVQDSFVPPPKKRGKKSPSRIWLKYTNQVIQFE